MKHPKMTAALSLAASVAMLSSLGTGAAFAADGGTLDSHGYVQFVEPSNVTPPITGQPCSPNGDQTTDAFAITLPDGFAVPTTLVTNPATFNAFAEVSGKPSSDTTPGAVTAPAVGFSATSTNSKISPAVTHQYALWAYTYTGTDGTTATDYVITDANNANIWVGDASQLSGNFGIPGAATTITDCVVYPQPGTAGPLSIDFVPDFDFGVWNTSDALAGFTSNASSLTSAESHNGLAPAAAFTENYAQVTDARSAAKLGWNLTVASSLFQDTSIGSRVQAASQTKPASYTDTALTGSTIQIPAGVAYQPTSPNATAPTTAAVTVSCDGTSQPVELMQASPYSITAAGTAVSPAPTGNAGKGTWADFMTKTSTATWPFASTDDTPRDLTSAVGTQGHSDVTLTVPQGSVVNADLYTAQLTWTLSDTPLA